MKKCPNRKPVFAEVKVPGETKMHPESTMRVAVNRAARRLVEKENRARRNRKISSMRLVLRDMRYKLVRGLVPVDKLENYKKAFVTGRQELRALMGSDA